MRMIITISVILSINFSTSMALAGNKNLVTKLMACKILIEEIDHMACANSVLKGGV
ncbi:hypothetical protein MNBD_GAMMA12-3693 [hydrothermal vent metagenome]|uniref:Uncharacterized protein n=1 Tax=hydrothermal vent metagenome TaxID=652676 RepID=A0A3B0Z4N6_9ZZZZ